MQKAKGNPIGTEQAQLAEYSASCSVCHDHAALHILLAASAQVYAQRLSAVHYPAAGTRDRLVHGRWAGRSYFSRCSELSNKKRLSRKIRQCREIMQEILLEMYLEFSKNTLYDKNTNSKN